MNRVTLSKQSVERAIDHITKYGDTDVFPHVCEIHFMRERRDDIVNELSQLDLRSYQPRQAIEVLSPKSRYGFRIVHQLHFVDTILFTASVIEIGEDLENLKANPDDPGPFAYRFNADSSDSLFQAHRTYRDWLIWQYNNYAESDFDYVIFTDIADFYQRIYLHRIESTLDVATGNKGVKYFVEKVIKAIRSRQSYGIPVGGSASRLIAEAVLTDSDAAILAEGIIFTRFVDDYRVYVQSGQSPYGVLSFLAEQLFLTEGLTLNGQKTKVLTRAQYTDYLIEELPEVEDRAEGDALERLAHSIYFSEEEPDKELIEQLKATNLVSELQKEVSEEFWDFGKIKALLRAIRIAMSANAMKYIVDHLEDLLPFTKEIVLFFDEVRRTGVVPPEQLKDRVVEIASGSVAKSVPLIHAWLLEFFARGIIHTTHKELESMKSGSILSDRQSCLIRGLNNDVNYFRKGKTRFETLDTFTKYAFILGASSLPRGEYEAWVGAIKGRMTGPLEALYCDWAKSKVGQIGDLLVHRVEEIEQ